MWRVPKTGLLTEKVKKDLILRQKTKVSDDISTPNCNGPHTINAANAHVLQNDKFTIQVPYFRDNCRETSKVLRWTDIFKVTSSPDQDLD